MAQNSRQVAVGIATPALLWQTTTGVSPDPVPASAGGTTGVFWAGVPTDPVPIVIENLDATNAVYLGPSGVSSSTGTKLAAGASITRNVVGNDSEYAIAVGGTVSVSVEVGRQ